MIYRQARHGDQAQIAHLHADSWRRTYRGLFTDRFLDHEAEADRLQAWAQRLAFAPANQAVYVAERNGEVHGFICVYGLEDPQWGSLVDNLHIAHSAKRQGLGRNLVAQAFTWLAQHYADTGVYLWVMETNQAARCFYEKLGAKNAGVIDKANPVGGGTARNCRYVWASPEHLIGVRDAE
jgi:ribosomal protein S18 acetylase RimI-like enzyme